MNIAKTRSQVDEHFGVHLRTFATWLGAGCPGQPGAYDLDQIAAWRAQRGPTPIREHGARAAAIAELTAAVNRLAAVLERTRSK